MGGICLSSGCIDGLDRDELRATAWYCDNQDDCQPDQECIEHKCDDATPEDVGPATADRTMSQSLDTGSVAPTPDVGALDLDSGGVDARAPALDSSAPRPDGTTPASDAAMPPPDGEAPIPDAVMVEPDDSSAPRPDGTTPASDAAMPSPDGEAPIPDAAMPSPDGEAPIPDAVMVEPDAGGADAAAPAQCDDGVRNGGESDVDCGGACSKCSAGLVCALSEDCESRVCTNQVCQMARCGDGIVNHGDETCDAGGESPECDDDCTLVSCGDGHTNMLAGEACDHGEMRESGCTQRCQEPARCAEPAPCVAALTYQDRLPPESIAANVEMYSGGEGQNYALGCALASHGDGVVVGDWSYLDAVLNRRCGNAMTGLEEFSDHQLIEGCDDIGASQGANVGESVDRFEDMIIVGASRQWGADDPDAHGMVVISPVSPGCIAQCRRDSVEVAQCLINCRVFPLRPPADGPERRFGISVAIHGDLAAVGAYQTVTGRAVTGLNEPSRLWCFGSNNCADWEWCQGQNGDRPGQCEHIADGSVEIYAFGESLEGCAAERDECWYKVSSLYREQPEGRKGGWFGYRVALDEETLVVSAPTSHVHPHPVRGAVYTYDRRDLNLNQDLNPRRVPLPVEGPDANDHFGSALAIDGDLLIVGARNDESEGFILNGDRNNRGAGAAYIFRRGDDGWRQSVRISPDVPVPGEEFGFSVALHRAPAGGNHLAVIGAPSNGAAIWGTQINDEDAQPNPRPGSVYIFEQQLDQTWTQVARLMRPVNGPQDGLVADLYGYSVAFQGRNRIVVGAVGHTGVLGSSYAAPGAIYRYTIGAPLCHVGEEGAESPCLCIPGAECESL
jgi:hypothetical protein